MVVEKNKVIGIHYTISLNNEGEVFSNLDFDPEEYVHGAIAIFPMVANALEGHKINDEVKVTLPPQHAYGVMNEKLIKTFSITLFENHRDPIVDDLIEIYEEENYKRSGNKNKYKKIRQELEMLLSMSL